MAGSRNEQPEQFGLAHFVGAHHIQRHRPPPFMDIINRMESVGGELNAFTSEEATTIYSLIPGGEPRACCRTHSRPRKPESIPEAEIDREREVVLDEVDSISTHQPKRYSTTSTNCCLPAPDSATTYSATKRQ